MVAPRTEPLSSSQARSEGCRSENVVEAVPAAEVAVCHTDLANMCPAQHEGVRLGLSGFAWACHCATAHFPSVSFLTRGAGVQLPV